MFSLKEIQKLVKQKDHENKQQKILKNNISQYTDMIATQISLNIDNYSTILPYYDKVYINMLSTELTKVGIRHSITTQDSKSTLNLGNLQSLRSRFENEEKNDTEIGKRKADESIDIRQKSNDNDVKKICS